MAFQLCGIFRNRWRVFTKSVIHHNRNLIERGAEMISKTKPDGSKIYAIIGAGGFGREIMPLAREIAASDAEAVFVDDDPAKQTIVNGHRVISVYDFLSCRAETKYFNIAISDCKTREHFAGKMIASDIRPFTIRAPNAAVYDENIIGEGAVLCPFTTVTSNTRIGRFFHANIYSYVAHDCVIGDFVTFAPNVSCNGGVVVEDCAYVGTGAVIRQGTGDRPIVIGKGSVVGMGAVVTKSVPPFTTVVGNPAVELKRRSPNGV